MMGTSTTRAVLTAAAVALAVLAGGWAPVRAQTLAEVSLSAAVASQLHPSVRLPTGSYRAVGAGTRPWVGRVPDAADWTEWEAYVARGLAARLRPAFVHQVVTSFAAAGFFERERAQRRAGGETHTRIVFEDDAGDRTLLYLIEGPDELLWLIAASR